MKSCDTEDPSSAGVGAAGDGGGVCGGSGDGSSTCCRTALGGKTLSTLTPREEDSCDAPLAEASLSACIVDAARASSGVAMVAVTLTLAAVQFTTMSEAATPGSMAASATAYAVRSKELTSPAQTVTNVTARVRQLKPGFAGGAPGRGGGDGGGEGGGGEGGGVGGAGGAIGGEGGTGGSDGGSAQEVPYAGPQVQTPPLQSLVPSQRSPGQACGWHRSATEACGHWIVPPIPLDAGGATSAPGEGQASQSSVAPSAWRSFISRRPCALQRVWWHDGPGPEVMT